MVRSVLHFLAALALLSLAACEGIPLSGLKPAPAAEVLVLREPVGWTHTQQLKSGDIDYRHRLAPGEYRAARDDAKGRYYQGGPGCLSWDITERRGAAPEMPWTRASIDCAIYVPFDGAQPARAFVFMNSARFTAADGTPRDFAGRKLEATPVTDGVDRLSQRQALAAPSAGAGVAGAALGGAVVNGIIAAERGNVKAYEWGDPAGIPRSAFEVR